MKIVLFANSLYNFRNYRKPVIDLLMSLGHKVYLVYPSSNDGRVFTYNNDNLSEFSLPQNFKSKHLNRLFLLVHYWLLILKLKPDLIMSFTVIPNLLTCLVRFISCRRFKIALNVTGMGSLFTEHNLRKSFLFTFIRKLIISLFSLADLIIVQNSTDLNFFKNYSRKTNVELVPGSGVNCQDFPEQNFYPEIVTFSYLGRFLIDKGLSEFLEAIKILNSLDYKFKVQIKGDFDFNNAKAAPIEIVNELKKIHNVYFFDFSEGDVSDFISSSSILILPSYREGLPKAALEFMSMCRPVIAFNVAGCSDLITHGVNGFLVDKINASSLAHQMSVYIKQRNLIPKHGYNANLLVKENYDVMSVQNSFEDILNRYFPSHCGL